MIIDQLINRAFLRSQLETQSILNLTRKNIVAKEIKKVIKIPTEIISKNQAGISLSFK